ncbi:MAG: SOS response-associated peptidase [Bacillota bacterium]|jgi:putative SOS response-associated peptidase YedK|nr:SOS response-associated peptidase [Bacillota bacterium]NLL60521.1 SOS response-associated peptidase [Tissierellia bacterium]
MCGRYYIDIDNEEIKRILKEAQKNIYENYKTGEIFPTNIAPIYIEDDINMKPLLAKWGFPKWDGKGVIINARAESINEKPMFKKLLLSNRCIVPASYYFEWKQENNRKEKYKIKRPGSNIYMAGLYNIVADNSRQLSLFNQSMDVYYTIITRNSNDSVSRIHKRMPLIFDAQEMFDWLEGKTISELMKADHELYGELT